MKLAALLYTSALCTATTAWQLTLVSRSGVVRHMHGTLNANCNTIAWGAGATRGDVKFIDFDPDTPVFPDPSRVTVYPGQTCGAGGVPFTAGVHTPAKGFWVGSYSTR